MGLLRVLLFVWVALFVEACAPMPEPAAGRPASSQRAAPSSVTTYVADLSGGNNGSGQIEVLTGNPNRVTGSITNGINGPQQISVDAGGRLYVANAFANTVTEYDFGQTSPAFTVSNGLSKPVGLALDRSGDLYVSNDGTMNPSVIEFAPKSNTILRTIISPLMTAPYQLAFDRRGNLFVSSGSAGVFELPSGSSQVQQLSLPGQLPFVIGVAVSSGLLYVGSEASEGRMNHEINVYTLPNLTRVEIIPQRAYDLSFTKSGELMVPDAVMGDLMFFPPGETAPDRALHGLGQDVSAARYDASAFQTRLRTAGHAY